MAYDSINPFGAERDNIHAGIIASTILNLHSKRRYYVNDFMLKDKVQKVQENVSNFAARLRAMAKPKAKSESSLDE